MNTRITEVASVELLGHDGELKWEIHDDGLHVTFPKKKPCDYAYALKITFKK
jgi:alpha-L-fucosidase